MQREEFDDIFSVMRQQDLLLHHPYDLFSTTVEEFINQAADDPQVMGIKMTLYRTSKDSPIIAALIRAAENGKQVMALVELKARFDEDNNIQWARQLERAGVHVVYGVLGLKTHTKIVLVVRKEQSHVRSYVHIGTGNYNSKTSKLYTDLGLLIKPARTGTGSGGIIQLPDGFLQATELPQIAGGSGHPAQRHGGPDSPRNRSCPSKVDRPHPGQDELPGRSGDHRPAV